MKKQNANVSQLLFINKDSLKQQEVTRNINILLRMIDVLLCYQAIFTKAYCFNYSQK